MWILLGIIETSYFEIVSSRHFSYVEVAFVSKVLNILFELSFEANISKEVISGAFSKIHSFSFHSVGFPLARDKSFPGSFMCFLRIIFHFVCKECLI